MPESSRLNRREDPSAFGCAVFPVRASTSRVTLPGKEVVMSTAPADGLADAHNSQIESSATLSMHDHSSGFVRNVSTPLQHLHLESPQPQEVLNQLDSTMRSPADESIDAHNGSGFSIEFNFIFVLQILFILLFIHFKCTMLLLSKFASR